MAQNSIAVIGMAGRFPGARNVEELWRNLEQGSVARREYPDEQLLREGVAAHLLTDTSYVKAGYPVDDVELFDAEFFKMSPREAAITDPQQRLFLECVWTALETAGYDPGRCRDDIGLFAGSKMNSYLLNNLTDPGRQRFDSFELLLGNDKDYLTSRVSYKLDLRGPSVVIQTACSSSLVAVHYACEALLGGECDMAVAGGVSIRVPVHAGYYYQKGAILSPDGFCRAYSNDAVGTVEGNGVGAVVLKRLEDAVRDGDNILAVVRGSAVNNDGAGKLGFTAPSGEGQARVISEALEVAGVNPREVTLVEGHGTGTPLGDPVEVTALSTVYRGCTDKLGYCALGSIKANIGHLDTAAGIASFIKVVQALRHRKIAPGANFARPNPELGLEHSPFYIPRQARDWECAGPRIAGVTSLGIGGTNCHVIVEEAGSAAMAGKTHLQWHLLALSARSPTAARQVARNLADHLEQHPDVTLADVAWTLLEGRRHFAHRQTIVCRDVNEAIRALRASESSSAPWREVEAKVPPLWLEVVPLTVAGARALAQECGTLPMLRNELNRAAQAARVTTRAELDPGQLAALDSRLSELLLLYTLARGLIAAGLHPQGLSGPQPICECIAGRISLDEAWRAICADDPIPAVDERRPAEARLLHLGGDQVCRVEGATLDAVSPEGGVEFQLVSALGTLWTCGLQVNAQVLYQDERRLRCSLPTYPFEYQRHWVEPRQSEPEQEAAQEPVKEATRAPAKALSYYVPSWRRLPVFRSDVRQGLVDRRVLVVGDELGVGRHFVRRVQELGCSAAQMDYPRCLNELREANAPPHYVVFCLESQDGLEPFRRILAVIQALGRANPQQVVLGIVTRDARDLLDTGPFEPHAAMLESFVNCVPLEYPQLQVKWLDVDSESLDLGRERTLDLVLAEMLVPSSLSVSFRNDTRWRKCVQPVALPGEVDVRDVVAAGGVYLLTGGLGAVALEICRYLSSRGPCRLILLAKPDPHDALPDPEGPQFFNELRHIERRRNERASVVSREHYEEFAGQLERLCRAYIAESFATPALARRMATADRFSRYTGFLRSASSRADGGESAESIRARLLSAHPQFAGMVDLLSHCVASYPAVFAGEMDPIKVLYPDGTGKLLARAYENTAAYGTWMERCELLLESIRLYRAQSGAGRTLRILEIGGGNGSLTKTLLPALAGPEIEYWFTDISKAFVREAQATARSQGFESVRFATFDITKDAEPQGFAHNSFDIIVGLDVVHATADIERTLVNLCSVLRAGGLLGLVETTRDTLWLSMVMGLTDGWWAFTDDRSHSPLLDSSAWRRKLEKAAPGSFAIFPETTTDSADTSLILLRKPSSARADAATEEHRRERLKQLTEAGAQITVLRADVSNRDELAGALRSLGPLREQITGVIHAAGVLDGKLIQTRTYADIDEILAPKVLGVRNLYHELQDHNLSLWVNCSSIVAVNGAVGQLAHCAANLYLDEFTAFLRANGQPNAISINWEAWSEIGQAEASRKRFQAQMSDRFRAGRGPRQGLLDWSELGSELYTVFEATFSGAGDWFLTGHRIQGSAVLPGTLFVELAVEAAQAVYGQYPVELSEISFVAPLFVADSGSIKVLIVMERREEHHELMIISLQPDLRHVQLHLTGRLRRSPVRGSVTLDLSDLRARCAGTLLEERVEENDARWNNLAWASVNDNMGLAEVRLPEPYFEEAQTYHLHPALLDVATGFLPLKFRRTLAFVPVYYKKIAVFAPLPGQVFSFARLRGNVSGEAESLDLNITLLDSAGTRLVDIERLTVRRVNTTTQARSEPRPESAQLAAFLRHARRLSDNWLTPAEGVEAFGKILASGLPQVVTTKQTLSLAPEESGPLMKTVREHGFTEAFADVLKPRPVLSSEYVRASSRLEKQLSGIWSSVLGVEDVGVEDNFFDLGGDSMLSIQVSSRVDKDLGIEIPSGTMFEFPTIRKLAQALQARSSEAEAAPARAAVAVSQGIPGPEAHEMTVIDRLVNDIRRKLGED